MIGPSSKATDPSLYALMKPARMKRRMLDYVAGPSPDSLPHSQTYSYEVVNDNNDHVSFVFYYSVLQYILQSHVFEKIPKSTTLISISPN